MQTGMLSSENLSNVLRGISQKRQHGVMELNFADRTVQIVFAAGKIVDLSDSTSPTIVEVLCWLIEGGWAEPHFQPGEAHTYSELFLALNNRPADAPLVTEDLFRRAVKQRVLDRLYRMDFGQPAIYNFRAQMPEYDREFSPLISVGQFLLDRVALETDSERFTRLFPENATVMRLEAGAQVLSEEEQVIYEILTAPITLDSLRKRSMLNCYHFQSALLGLYDRASIEVERETNGAADHYHAAGTPLSEDLVGALEGSTERPFISTDQLRVVPEEKVLTAAVESTNGLPEPIEDASVETGSAVQPLGALVKKAKAARQDDAKPDLSIGRLFFMNIRLLQSNTLPNGLTLIFFAAALLAAFFRWNAIFARF